MIGKGPLERRTLSVYPLRGSQLSQRESQGRFAPYQVQPFPIQPNTQATGLAGGYYPPLQWLGKLFEHTQKTQWLRNFFRSHLFWN